ncbi:MAG: hypothetical protein FJY77_01505 [Candidatus Altiarchaeales archaeon]|nr:hypothetical protein [Candidatus Altiarchaeales archaeon]
MRVLLVFALLVLACGCVICESPFGGPSLYLRNSTWVFGYLPESTTTTSSTTSTTTSTSTSTTMVFVEIQKLNITIEFAVSSTTTTTTSTTTTTRVIRTPYCGDGFVDSPEECDPGNSAKKIPAVPCKQAGKKCCPETCKCLSD